MITAPDIFGQIGYELSLKYPGYLLVGVGVLVFCWLILKVLEIMDGEK